MLLPDVDSNTDQGQVEGDAGPARNRGRRIKWRPWLRALHRDVGYFVVGLTVVYALSGIAVNHLKDWDPNFKQISATHHLQGPFPADDAAASAKVLAAFHVVDKPSDVYRDDNGELDIVLEHRTFHVDTKTGKVFEEGQKPRFILRAANWLHLNRGKKAWTYFADTYATLLLFLALGGLFMIPGRKGLIGRGAVIALVGAAVPILYVTLSGGP